LAHAPEVAGDYMLRTVRVRSCG